MKRVETPQGFSRIKSKRGRKRERKKKKERQKDWPWIMVCYSVATTTTCLPSRTKKVTRTYWSAECLDFPMDAKNRERERKRERGSFNE
jgi:hypothetical protein